MNEKRTFTKQAGTLLVLLFAVAAPSLSNAQESAKDGLQRCGLIDDASARLTCYDKLGGRKNAAALQVIEQPALAKDDLSLEPLKARSEQKTKPDSEIVKVTKCIRSGGNKKYTFYLEGGQVWKQVSDKRLDFNDCNFSASIRKDFFGFKMQLEGSKKRFRVSRIR
ncbi:MAG: hypothetical protein ACJAVV_003845 [Alphaproteobacteria bacterium]|jgi:hypothetical protein